MSPSFLPGRPIASLTAAVLRALDVHDDSMMTSSPVPAPYDATAMGSHLLTMFETALPKLPGAMHPACPRGIFVFSASSDETCGMRGDASRQAGFVNDMTYRLIQSNYRTR